MVDSGTLVLLQLVQNESNPMKKNKNRQWGVRTSAIHAGEGIDPVSRASSPNLVMSATFAPTEVAGFSARNRENYEGFVYARLSNPTVKQLEDKLAALEGAESCQCYASGMAASSALMLGRLSKGDRKSTRLNSSHMSISYAVFCLKKK